MNPEAETELTNRFLEFERSCSKIGLEESLVHDNTFSFDTIILKIYGRCNLNQLEDKTGNCKNNKLCIIAIKLSV